MRAPRFWQHDGWLPALLAPASGLVAAATARRVARPGWRAPVPVICCGGVTVGGAGKTTLALAIGRLLAARGLAVHFLTRGYGGQVRGVVRVKPGDDAGRVGDEALLLAEVAPCWVSADRAAAGRAAVQAGAQVLVLDDGLQNPSLAKDVSLLAIDGRTGFGNARVMPAGPLREPVHAAAARCQAAILIGPDLSGAGAMLPPELPVLRAHLRADCADGLAGSAVYAFAGIASPEKFYATLQESGARLVGRRAFADHHPYTAAELRRVLNDAARLGATPVTTPKDAARLPPHVRQAVRVVGVHLEWERPEAISALLGRILP